MISKRIIPTEREKLSEILGCGGSEPPPYE